MTNDKTMPSDFWWVSPEEETRYRFLYLGHHHPVSDDENPFAVSWFHSLKEDHFSKSKVRYQSGFLETWRERCTNTNVYRSLKLFSTMEGSSALMGPFLVDIDNSQWSASGDALEENLEDALDVTCRTVKLLTSKWQISERDFKVFFSGRKGFNIEIRPWALGITGNFINQLRLSFEKQNEIMKILTTKQFNNTVGLRGTVIDPIYGTRLSGPELKHPFVRLHDSINLWRTNIGEVGRRRICIAPDVLYSININEILNKCDY